MVRKLIELDIDVVKAARHRIINAFSNGVKVYLSISGGKDSIVLADLTYELIREGRIDPKLLHVVFIDEEAMFDDVIDIVKDWRRKFLAVGAQFHWFCIEVKHFNCFNQLTNDESFICWDHTVKDRWVREMPPYAITSHPKLNARQDSYQKFLPRFSNDGIRMAGVRISESVQRRQTFRQKFNPNKNLLMPIFDWKDTDIWRYIQERELKFPETYIKLYQVGLGLDKMRISQFFSIDTAKVLVRLNEHSPGLMDRVIRREPNAYLASMYWDTEMFRSAGGSGEARKSEDEDTTTESWQTRTLKIANDPSYLDSNEHRRLARRVKRLALQFSENITEKEWKTAYSVLVGGDPKDRNLRALMNTLAMRKTGKI